jgi:hypothetical protein
MTDEAPKRVLTEDDKIYQSFIETSNALVALTKKKKELAEQITAKFEAEKLFKVVAPNGLITKVSRKIWKYPDGVKSTIQKIQKASQDSGEAKQDETEFLKVSLR